MTSFTSILQALETRPLEQPEQQVYAYADEHGNIDQRISWRELAYRTGVLTGYLRRERGLQAGDRVLLVYPPSIDFVIAFAGCLRAGLIPVPVYPPNPRKFDSGMEAFLRIAHDCDAKLVLTSEQYEKTRNRGGVQQLAEQDPARWALALEWVSTDLICAEHHEPLFGPAPKPADVALIQYTSGSTSAPKGVVITHGNLAHQMEYTRRAMKLNADSRCVFWVPQYHDLGLIGGIVTALAGHVQLTLCSPYAFIKRPALWFELLHKEHFKEKLKKTVEEKNRLFVDLYNDEPVSWEDIYEEYCVYADKISPFVCDTVELMAVAIEDKKKILFEGAQGALLDVDFGTYPFTTSSNASAGGVSSGIGVSPKQIHDIIGIMKAYATRVGSGPFPTEIDGEQGEHIRKKGEKGNQNPRRVYRN